MSARRALGTAKMTAVGRAVEGWASAPAPAAGPRPQRQADASMMALVARISEDTGAPSIAVMSDAAALSLGPGKPSFSDYVRLRLFDEAFWSGADRRAVV